MSLHTARPAAWTPPDPLPGSISDGTLTLRHYRYADAPAIWAGVESSRHTLHPWMQWLSDYAVPEDAVAFVGKAMRSIRNPLSPENNAGTGIVMGIFDAATGEFLGGTGFNRIDPATHNAEIGYWVRADRHRRGIASGALRLILTLGFTPQDRGGLGFRRVHIFAGELNTASVGVPDKLGLRRSAHLRQDRWIDGIGWADTVGWDVLAGEWDCGSRRLRA